MNNDTGNNTGTARTNDEYTRVQALHKLGNTIIIVINAATRSAEIHQCRYSFAQRTECLFKFGKCRLLFVRGHRVVRIQEIQTFLWVVMMLRPRADDVRI